MKLDLLLTGSIDFEGHEEYLAFRFRLLSTILLATAILGAILLVLDWSDLVRQNPNLSLLIEAQCALSIALLLGLRKHKKRYFSVCVTFTTYSLLVYVAAMIYVVTDELRIVWFYLHIWMVYILLGARIGTITTVVIMACLFGANQHLPRAFSEQALTTAMISLVAASLLSFLYSNRTAEFFKQLTENKLHLQELASTDPLTGVLNPRAFYEAANRMIRLAQRSESPFSVLFVDLDYFKQINDRFGHEAGDFVLRSVASCLAGQTRHSDVLGRIGGEEFAVFLPETDLDGALQLAEKLRAALEGMETGLADSKTVQITASVGVAQSSDRDASIAEILRRADNAMYLAKAKGRNQIIVAGNDIHAQTDPTA